MRYRSCILAAGFLIAATAFNFGNTAAAESDGWITLLDSTHKGDWSEVGKANWEMKDGALTADKLDGKDLAYLVSKNSYKDFQIRAEFWVDDEANSGIFIRCDKSDAIDSKICYEVRSRRKDRISPSCSMARRPPMSTTASTRADRSPCNMARAW